MNPLKIGLLLDSLKVPTWFFYMISDLKKMPGISIDFIVLNDSDRVRSGSKLHNIINNRGSFLYTLYSKIDSKLFSGSVNDSFSIKNILDLVGDVKIEKVKPIGSLLSDKFSKEDIEKLKTYKPDILIRGGFRILRGDILKIPKCGIWSYHHGDNSVNRGGPAAFWETLERHPVSGATLQILNEDLDNGVLIERMVCNTDYTSVSRNRENVYGKARHLLPRQVKKLQEKGAELFMKELEDRQEAVSFYSQRLYRKPGNAKMLRLISRYLSYLLFRKISSRFNFYPWKVLLSVSSSGLSSSAFRYKSISNPKGYFRADPFVRVKDSKAYIFLEEFSYKSKRAHLSVVVTDMKGREIESGKILEKPYHLSYPFLFEYEGKLFMLPESSQNNSIDCYECKSFPYHWEFKCTLMDNVNAVDSTLFQKDGLWWMFTCFKKLNGSTSNEEMQIFYSDQPFGNWQPHALNPICSDVRKARAAGNIFEKNGKIIRPAQDGSNRYGYASRFFEIEKLTAHEYSEKEITSIYPFWQDDVLATHTFNFDGPVSVIDAKFKQSRWNN